MNYQELRDKIEKIGLGKIADEYVVGRESEFIPGLKLVHEIGGGEGEGEYVERVFHYEQTDIYVKIIGYYYSYDGTTWDRVEQVFPQQKTITVYESK